MPQLNREQIQQALDAGVSPQQIQSFMKTGTASSGYLPATAKKVVNSSQPVFSKDKGILGNAASGINFLYDKFKNLPVIKQVSQGVGAVVGTAGAIEGGIIGGVGQVVKNAVTGDSLGKDVVKSAVQTGKETAKFGYEIGKEGAPASALGFGGRAIQVPLAFSQGYQGIKDLYDGGMQKDVSKQIQGAIEIGTSAFATKGALETKGMFVNPEAVSAVKSTPEAIKQSRAKSTLTKFNDLIGNITQGDAQEIPKAQRALTQIDTNGVKTYSDLVDRFDEKIGQVSAMQDNVLGTDKTVRLLDNLALDTKVGNQNVSHNYVQDGLAQLKEFYSKTNDVQGESMIDGLIQKSQTEGLTLKDVNDIARLHGSELNAYNANGQLASGLTKQAAENTRVGIKETARNLFDNKVYQASDGVLSDLIKTRKLIQEVSDKVTELQNKIQTRSLGAKVGILLGKIINFAGLGTPKGIVEALIPRGQGFKVMNALDMQKSLEANLKLFEKLNSNINGSKSDVISAMEDFIKEAEANKKNLLALPAPGETSPSTTTIEVYPKQGSKDYIGNKTVVNKYNPPK